MHNWSAVTRKLQSGCEAENVTLLCPYFLKAPLDWRETVPLLEMDSVNSTLWGVNRP